MAQFDVSPSSERGDEGPRIDSEERRAIAMAQASIDRVLSGNESQSTDESGAEVTNLATLVAALEILAEFGSKAPRGKDESDDQPFKFGRFEILQERGRGGFGIVLRAFDPVLQREIALKIPRPERLLAGYPADDFLREAQLAAKLEHTGIVRVYETRRLGPIWYIASAYCDGPTLAEWLIILNEPITPQLAARLIAEVAEAIHYAHTRGILHLDLKPENILVEASDLQNGPRLLVTDFGLAGRHNEQKNGGAPRIAGTFAYMSPEQRAGDATRIGTASDIYSLGAILYDILRHAISPEETTTKEAASDRTSPPKRLPLAKVPKDLDAICQKCLSEQPSNRYDSARDLAADLNRFLRGESVMARVAPWGERFVSMIRRRPIVSALVAVLVATALIGSTTITFLWRRAESSLVELRAEREHHAETSTRMSHALLTLTRLTQEGRLQPRLTTFDDRLDIQLLNAIYDDIHAWTEETADQLPHGKALQTADHSLSLVDGMDRLEGSHRNEAFAAGTEAWRRVIEDAPDQPQYRRALALHLLTYAANSDESRWLWWRQPQKTDAKVEEAVAELAIDYYPMLLVELASKRVRLRQIDIAYGMLDSAITLLEEHRNLHDPDHTRLQTALVAYTALADVQQLSSHEELARQSLKKGEELADTAPNVDECPALLAVAVGELHKARAKYLARRHDDDATLAAFGRAQPYLERAVKLLPQQLIIRLSLDHLFQQSAKLSARRGRTKEAVAFHYAAIASLDEALTQFPGHRNLLGRRGRAQALLAWRLIDRGDDDDVQGLFESAVGDFEQMGLSNQDAAAEWMQAIRCWQELGAIYAEQGLTPEAINAHQKALSLLEELRPRRENTASFKERFHLSRATLAKLAPGMSP